MNHQKKTVKIIKTSAVILVCAITLSLLSGCATKVSAPCSHYGAFCSKTPINGWDHS
jgi:hypothetical protein